MKKELLKGLSDEQLEAVNAAGCGKSKSNKNTQ